jgi:DNA-binding LacI/PurR family transcriptional regulator
MKEPKKPKGDGINSIHEIARIARVSPATVSRVINNQANVKQKTRMRINEIIKESNYSPRVVKRRTLTIGVLIEEEKFVFGNYVSEIMEGAFEYAAELGYNISLFSLYEERMSRQGVLSILRDSSVDGVIILLNSERCQYIRDFEKERFPYIVMNNIIPGVESNYIDSDNKKGIQLGLQCLFDLGHRDILFLGGSFSSSDHKQRHDMYLEIMKQKGFYRPELVANGGGDFKVSLREGYQKMTEFLQKSLAMTAVFAINDDQAIGAIKAITEKGLKVPVDVSVVGFDDYTISSYCVPSLTTVKQPLKEMARTAASRLVGVINGTIPYRVQISMDPELIVRQSTSAAREKR